MVELLLFLWFFSLFVRWDRPEGHGSLTPNNNNVSLNRIVMKEGLIKVILVICIINMMRQKYFTELYFVQCT